MKRRPHRFWMRSFADVAAGHDVVMRASPRVARVARWQQVARGAIEPGAVFIRAFPFCPDFLVLSLRPFRVDDFQMLQRPGDRIQVNVRAAEARKLAHQLAPWVPPDWIATKSVRGATWVSVQPPPPRRMSITQRLRDLKPGAAFSLPLAAHETTMPTLATRMKYEDPTRRYRTHINRKAGAITVERVA
jgi:hypothetical protein